MRKLILMAAAGLLLSGSAIAGGFHNGEFKDLDVQIDYYDYAYKTPAGEPVYYIGQTMRYKVTLKNKGNRTFKNFQAKSTLYWTGNFSCVRYWYDNQPASYFSGQPLPGNSNSGLRMSDMDKRGESSYEVRYPIPLSVCPGQGDILVEGRHRNSSGREEVASFRIPMNVVLKRKD